ncbi:MAG: radical SAM family heme chaperone HemW [Erysipelotrichaceae bacterium]|nr:radical SAM family heme chaperone HemW [Erysipelotrichaceae bacterium]
MKALYVHIPFCDHICSYCDFCKVYTIQKWIDPYLDALAYEINDKHINDHYDTIYIGGGTPSSLNINQLTKLFELLKPLSKHVLEYTIEVNPESMDDNKLKLFYKYHINRLSIGVQTFHDNLLKSIDRYHTSIKATDLIQSAHSIGIKDINVDLIYGLPLQTLQDVYEDIDIIKELDISHVSIYSLILEDHTKLKNINYQPLNDEQDAYWYDHIHEYLLNNDFKHYEVSNYYHSKPSLHNLIYWHYQDYDGIGVSAHALKNHHRYENTRCITQYMKFHYLENSIELSKNDEMFEKLMMGLRLVEGVDIFEFNELYQVNLLMKYHDIINKYRQLKMLEIHDHYLRTTHLGMKYLNSILVDFLD